MAFANPLLLFLGAGLVALPVILHLIMQQKPRHFVFPALQFIRQRLSTNQRRLRVRHWILLLLRCLGVFLIALAFAKPSAATNLFGTWLTLGALGFVAVLSLFILIATVVLTKPLNKLLFGINAAIFAALVASIGSIYSTSFSENAAAKLGSDQAPVSAVVLMDCSPRMLYEVARETEEGITQAESRLDEAKRLGDWLIRELPDDSNVAIADTSPSEPFFSVDFAAAAKRLSALQITYNAVPLVERIEAAIDFLESIKDQYNQPREIYIFTDLTLESWKSKRQKQLQLRLDDLQDISVYVIDLSVENPTNYQLGDLELSSESAAPGGSINISTRVIRQGPSGERPVNLYIDKVDPSKPNRQDGRTVYPDEKLVRMAAVKFDENGVEQVGFALKDLPVGIHHGVLRIEGVDSLPADNERFFTVQIREPWKILLIRPRKIDETETEVVSRNVEVVLAPDELVQSGQTPFVVKTIDQADLLDERLGDYAAAFLLDPKPLSTTAWEELKKYASTGHGLCVVLGENAKTNFGVDSSFLSPEAQEVIGAEIGEVWTPVDAYLSMKDYSHPIAQSYQKFDTDDVWRDFPVYQHWGLRIPEENSNLNVIAEFTSQKAALISHPLGDGSVVVMTTPLTEPGQVVGRNRWNDLTTGEWWPGAMLIDRIGKYLVASKNNRLNFRVGENVVLKEEDDLTVSEFLLFSPRNEEPTVLSIEENELRYRFTETVGNYRIKPIGSVTERRGFSVNIEREETNLQQVSDQVLEAALGKNRFKLARTRDDIIREQSYVREGKKFFPLLLTLFAIIVLIELAMSNLFYRGL